MPERVGVRELRQNLSRWLRRVEAGETFEVTDRGEPVALLVPLRNESDAIRRLAAEGRLAHVGRGNLARLGPPTKHASRPISDTLDELREDRV